MAKLKISETKDYFIDGGKGFFYLADTAWAAFANASTTEWREYLDYRRMQGFNALQIIVLPIGHDASESDLDVHPFMIDKNGKYDYYNVNDEYFNRAAEMLGIASQKGFIPVLAPIWSYYVKDSWASENSTKGAMPLDVVKTYIEYVVKVFSKYNPIYIVSGDTQFETGDINKYYDIALETVKSISPDTLTTMHLCTDTYLPDEFAKSPKLDFYMYQSGHRIQSQDLPYITAQRYWNNPVRKPVINGEPCYEGHGYAARYGRFNEFDIRKAIWQSLLSGAKAGVAYGAHGIWSWHKREKKFINETLSGTPYDWRTAVRLKGAWDAAFAKWIFEVYNLFDIVPKDCIVNETKEIRLSLSRDSGRIAIYAPYNTDIKVNMDLDGYEWVLINLSERLFAKPEVKYENGLWLLKMHEFNSDVLLIGCR